MSRIVTIESIFKNSSSLQFVNPTALNKKMNKKFYVKVLYDIVFHSKQQKKGHYEQSGLITL